MGRYRVQLDLASSPELQQFYSFHWALIGNLGVDLLIIPMAKLFGLELGVKLIVIAIPVLTVAGMLWIAREAHGRIPPTAVFALPLAYSHPFIFGFVNYSLAMALALNALALWMRWGRLERLHLRAGAFVVIAPVLWITHAFGWGAFGLLAGSAELMRQRAQGKPWGSALVGTIVQCLPLAPPLLLMVIWRSGAVSGDTGDWFDWPIKLTWITTVFRDRWALLDRASLVLLLALAYVGLRDRRFVRSAPLVLAAAVLSVTFLLLPRILLSSAYADMRIVPFALMMVILAIRPVATADPRLVRGLAAVGAAFLILRLAAATASFAVAGAAQDRALAALDHVPRGARLVSLVGQRCGVPWGSDRFDHLPAMATVRRHAFSNDQWNVAGAQLLSVHKPDAPAFQSDPSQFVWPAGCAGRRSLDAAIAAIPRPAFDYLWLLDAPPFDAANHPDLRVIWQGDRSMLLRIAR